MLVVWTHDQYRIGWAQGGTLRELYDTRNRNSKCENMIASRDHNAVDINMSRCSRLKSDRLKGCT